MKLQRKHEFYERYVKRLLDVICALGAFLVFCWLFALVAVLVRVKLGKPVLFRQPRPGLIDPKTGKERIFYMYKFRSMTDERDETGNLLPDEVRLTAFGRKLRATSMDELPEAFNILKGDMSVIGPRPQLIRDMVFMTEQQRMRHTAKPGLSGLAQVMGRNAINWEEKLDWDLKYIERVSFSGDAKIIWLTVKKVFVRDKITDSSEEIDLAPDYGDALLQSGKITKDEYDAKQNEAKQILAELTE